MCEMEMEYSVFLPDSGNQPELTVLSGELPKPEQKNSERQKTFFMTNIPHSKVNKDVARALNFEKISSTPIKVPNTVKGMLCLKLSLIPFPKKTP